MAAESGDNLTILKRKYNIFTLLWLVWHGQGQLYCLYVRKKPPGAGSVEENLPAEQQETAKQTRLLESDVHEIGEGRTQEEKGEGPEKARARLSRTTLVGYPVPSSTHPMSPKRVFLRLHRRKDILRVIKNGKRVRGFSFDLVALQEEGETRLRVAVVVPLYGMRAVDRNRVRRRTVDAINRGGFLEGVLGDFVLRARKNAYGASHREIQDELRRTFNSLRREGGG